MRQLHAEIARLKEELESTKRSKDAEPPKPLLTERDQTGLEQLAKYIRHTDKMECITGAILARAILALQAEVAALKAQGGPTS